MKIRLLALLLSVLLLTVIACPSAFAAEKTVTLYVYNWGEYISDGSEGCMDVNREFEKYFNTNLASKYGYKVEVNYSTFSSCEDMYAKILGGSVAYDVIIPSDYMVERMAKENLLRPLNFDHIPNYFLNICDEFRNPDYDPENLFSVPYAYGMIGVIYNTSIVDKDDKNIGSWKLMFDENSPYKGDILQFNNPRDAFGTAQYYLGFDVNDTDRNKWNGALELLKKQKNIVQGYVMDEIFNKMESGSAAIAAYYVGDYFTMYEDNEDLEFFYPREGTNYYVDAFCVPYNSQNPTLAEEYINYMISEEPAVANAEYTYYASPNQAVINNKEYQECMTDIKENAMELLYGDLGDDYVKSSYRNLNDDGLQQMNDLWEELKVESSISSTIYVLCGIILVVLIGAILFFAIRRRLRAI